MLCSAEVHHISCQPCAWCLSTLHMACKGSVMELSTCAQTAII